MAGKGTYILRGDQKYETFRSKTFNIDNGSGTTDDDVLFADLDFDIEILAADVVYTVATDTTGAAGATISLGTTAGGVDVVAAVALTAAKAVGSTQALTLVATKIAAGTDLFARHTGIAATEAGEYYVQIQYRIFP